MTNQKLLFFAFIFSTLFFSFSVNATNTQPPHIDLEASSSELAHYLEQSFYKKTAQASDTPFSQILAAGERNLSWLKHINKYRRVPISLYDKGQLRGIPIESPLRYGEASILKGFYQTKARLPQEMTRVLFHNAPFTKEPPLSLKEYKAFARAIDYSYQMAARWILMKPYLDWLTKNRRKDIRGFYHLSRKDDLKKHLDHYNEYTELEKQQLRWQMTSLCFSGSRHPWEQCEQEVVESLSRLYELSQKYWNKSSNTYQSFFEIPDHIKNPSTSLSGERLISKFKPPLSLEKREFVKKNIEEEWQKDFLKLHIDFEESEGQSRVFIEWVAGATAHVKGLGSNHIVMDANSSLDDWDTQWVIRHEFGHVLGLPDCYIEFYEPNTKEIVSYQIDVNDLMCSRKGVYQPRITEELLKAYQN